MNMDLMSQHTIKNASEENFHLHEFSSFADEYASSRNFRINDDNSSLEITQPKVTTEPKRVAQDTPK